MNPRHIRILWHVDFYDGRPLSGLCLYKNKKCWFKSIHEQHIKGNDRYIVYVVLELTPEQVKEEVERWRLFEEHVGTHCSYNEKNQRDYEGVKPRENHHLFYDQYKKRIEPNYLETNKIIKAFVE